MCAFMWMKKQIINNMETGENWFLHDCMQNYLY